MFVHDVVYVVENLTLFRPLVVPVGFTFKGVALERGGDVAFGAGVMVVSLGAADIILLFENDEVIQARLLELDGHANTGKSATDDNAMKILIVSCHWWGARQLRMTG